MTDKAPVPVWDYFVKCDDCRTYAHYRQVGGEGKPWKLLAPCQHEGRAVFGEQWVPPIVPFLSAERCR